MPEYLAPGVYIEETSFRAKSIEGVSTTTTGFIGPTRYGPLDLEPDIVTGLGEFERIYGDRQQLKFGSSVLHNYLWHATRSFFEEGGKRLYIMRVFKPLAGTYPPADFDVALQTTPGSYDDGHARASLPSAGGVNVIRVRARFPGAAGNLRVRFTIRLGQNILGGTTGRATIGSVMENDVVWINDVRSPISSPPGAGSLYIAAFDKTAQTWRFKAGKAGGNNDLWLNHSNPALALDPDGGFEVRIVTVTVTVLQQDGTTLVWDGLPPDPDHQRDGSPDSLASKFAVQPSNLAQERTLPLVITAGSGVTSGIDWLQALFAAKADLRANLEDLRASDADRSVDAELTGGNDGLRPELAEYEGRADEAENAKTGLKAFEDIEDISIIAAPGSTLGYENGYRANAASITNLLISHAERMRYRIAVLDSGDSQSIAQVRALRAKMDSKYAALYYPWVRVLDPVTRTEIYLPPSGFVAGIYARNDINRAVYKAPANEVVNGAIGFEIFLNKSQQDVLNPEGINCFRFFEGRGFRLWGARTISSDPEWKYVNLRRYFIYLERSIDRGTQWAVFEPNGEQLWANVRRTIEDFLLNEWMNGALLGDKPEKAYFVRCDRSTMTQNDLDNGRLVCLIGVAPLRPAEFVIFRIGQWTADRRS
ncbi:MAG TPA: phage tail sheath subtilisin-like domain-containing protein [Methylomirabilota bacterium]|jgi:phage tail sheath protein FI|nr:phage tail sheath subtilisin-like domain-containing protein [Methylomirabilota bacterium]